MNNQAIKKNIKILGNLDFDEYDPAVDILISAAKMDLKESGVSEITEESPLFDLYCMAIHYSVSLGLGNVENINFAKESYKNLSIKLRSYVEKSSL